MNEAELEKKICLHHWDKVCALIGEKLQIESHQYRLKGHNQIIDILAYTNTHPRIYYIFELKIDGINAKDMGQVENYALLLKGEKELYDHQIKIIMIGKDKAIDTRFIAKWNHIPFDKQYISYKQILNEEENMPHTQNERKNFSIAITNSRGGVGKSTTAFILACLLQKKGYKVLAIDMDHQGTLTYCALNGQDNSKIKQGISTILLENADNPTNLVKRTEQGFDLIPANASLKDDQYQIDRITSKETLLKELILSRTDLFSYDVVIVDVQGSIGTLFQLATLSTDKSLIVFDPIQADENPIRNTLHEIRKSKLRMNKQTKNEDLFLGALPSKYNGHNIHIKGLDYLTNELFNKIPIKVYTPVKNLVAFQSVIGTFDLPKGNLEPYEEVIADIEKQL